ncbi:MAG: hypothetical protein KAV68_04185 [Dehalococcoidales bacterium]|nr:hypothetical protein [Dehalococcoidales bacterium]
MGMLGGIVCVLAALCGVMGILTATDVISPLSAELTWLFWFALSGILFIASIALGTGRTE